MKRISYIKALNEYNMTNLKDIAKKCNIKITIDGKYKLKKDLIKDINIVLKKLAKQNKKLLGGEEEEKPKEIGKGSFGIVYQPPFNKKLIYRYKVQKINNKSSLIKIEEEAKYDSTYIGKILLNSYHNIDLENLENLKFNCKEIYDDVINSFKIQICDPNKNFTIPLEEVSLVSSPQLNKNQLVYKYGGRDLLDILRFVNLEDIDNIFNIKYLLEGLLRNIYNELILRDIYHLDIRLPNILYDDSDKNNLKLNLIDFGLVIQSKNIIGFIKYLYKNGMNIVNRPIEYDIFNALFEKDKNNGNDDENYIKKQDIPISIYLMLKLYIKSYETRKNILNMTVNKYDPSFYIDDNNIIDITNCDKYFNKDLDMEKRNIFTNYLINTYLNINEKLLCEKIVVFYIGVLLNYINNKNKIFSKKLINKCMEMNYLNRCNLIDIINNIDKNYNEEITYNDNIKMSAGLGLSLLSRKPSSTKIKEKVITKLQLSLIKPLKIEKEEQEIIKLNTTIYNITKDEKIYTTYDIRQDIVYDDFMNKNIEDILNMKI